MDSSSEKMLQFSNIQGNEKLNNDEILHLYYQVSNFKEL
jgi:hypothetical protein